MSTAARVVLLAALILTMVYWSLFAAGPASVEMEFTAILGGREIGAEKAVLTLDPDTETGAVRTRGDLDVGGASVRIETELRWAGPDAAVEGYGLTATQSGVPQTVTMKREGAKVTFIASGAGQELTRSAEAAEPFLVLDNMVAGHYLHLLQKVKDAGAEPVSVAVAVPGVMKVLQGRVTMEERETGIWGGTTVPVTVRVVQLTNILVYVRSSPEVAGGLLEVTVPVQGFEFTRKGFIQGAAVGEAPAARPAPPAGVSAGQTEVRSGDVVLGATLTLPAGRRGRVPGVVLVHGSGPNDRDETIAEVNKPFRDIAEGLSARGIAVLRYDKRSFALRGAMSLEELRDRCDTLDEEVVVDAVAALELLRARPEVDPDRVYVLGHSLGGTALPYILGRAGWAAGGISLAGAARPLDEMTLDQSRYLLEAQGREDEIEAAVGLLTRSFQRIRSGEAADDEVILGGTAGYWRNVLALKPAAEAAKVVQPMLFLRGAKDYQVTAADQRLWMAAASEAGKENASFKTFPDLNHLFMKVEGASDATDYQRPGRVAPEVMEEIALWIAEQAPVR